MVILSCQITPQAADELEALFCEMPGCPWTLEQKEPTDPFMLKGFYDTPEEARAGFARLKAAYDGTLPETGHLEALDDRDWQEAYKAYLHAWSHDGLHWIPEWQRPDYTVPAGDAAFYFDAGLAFGTGNHETTRLCVRRLLDARDDWNGDLPRKTVIDAGCGSGILAISARKLGFREIFAFDNDPDSVRISLDNARLCGVEGRIAFQWTDLQEGLQGRSADLLLANILSPVLCAHAELLVTAVQPGGRLVLSGILQREHREVHESFARTIQRIWRIDPPVQTRQDEDWADLLYARPH